MADETVPHLRSGEVPTSEGASAHHPPGARYALNLVGESVLARMEQTEILPAGSRVHLRAVEAGDSDQSTVNQSDDSHATIEHIPKDPTAQAAGGTYRTEDLARARYRILGEVARGGMGAVLRGVDNDLGREIAVKVILERHAERRELLQRFVEESRITGQLQHPGIVPVYELGLFPDQSPYFTMKFVQGQTLADLLAQRESPAHDQPRFLKIFEQVSQTLAYAHARGVIHRDLKPANIMVGRFGEVQVMDWGLAKVLKTVGGTSGTRSQATSSQPGAINEPREPLSISISISSSGSGVVAKTEVGTILGTPAYMPPEQASGLVDELDERSDVFGLGAILCEILTSQPPYQGNDPLLILEDARLGRLADAIERLDHSGAEDRLISLAKGCLAIDPDQRPANAGVVAAEVIGFLESVAERLRQTEIAHVREHARAEQAQRTALAAQAQARAERRSRWLTLSLALVIFVLLLVGGGGWVWWNRQRQLRQARLDLAVRSAQLLFQQADRSELDPAKWTEAREAARQAADLLAEVPGSPRATETQKFLDQVLQAAQDSDRDRTLPARLVEIRSAKIDDYDGRSTIAAYAEAFRAAGLDLAALETSRAVELLRTRRPAILAALVSALDDWANVVRAGSKDRAAAARLTDVAQGADPDPWRGKLRAALDEGDQPKRLAALSQLAADDSLNQLPGVSLNLLGMALLSAADTPTAERVLRAGVRRQPDDVWLNYDLADALHRQGRIDESIRFYSVARALRPDTSHQLGHVLEEADALADAIDVFEELSRIHPENGRDLLCLSHALNSAGRRDQAAQALRAATEQLRKQVERSPTNAIERINLGIALSNQGQRSDGEQQFRAVLKDEPENALALSMLSNNLNEQKRFNEAIPLAREAVRIKPTDVRYRSSLGLALRESGQYPQAVVEFEAAVKLRPQAATPRTELAIALKYAGRRDEAGKQLEKVIQDHPNDARAHANLGMLFQQSGRLDDAEREFREAIRFDPADARYPYVLANLLGERGQTAAAEAAYREAIRRNPSMAEPRVNLGVLMNGQGRRDEAIVELREALRLNPQLPEAHYNLGRALLGQGRAEEALEPFRAAVRLAPQNPLGSRELGMALIRLERREEAIAVLRQALALKPEDGQIGNNLGLLLSETGRLEEAAEVLRKAVRGRPTNPIAFYTLGNVLSQLGEVDQAVTAYRDMLKIQPDHAEAHCNLGQTLRAQGRFEQALAELKRGHEIGSKRPDWRYQSSRWIEEVQPLAELERNAVERLAKPESWDDLESEQRLALARIAENRGELAASVKLYEQSIARGGRIDADIIIRAAAAAVQAATRTTGDSSKLSDAERAGLLDQARGWVTDVLATLERSGPTDESTRRLRRLSANPNLKPVRDRAELKKLPEPSRLAWTALWSKVDTLLHATKPTESRGSERSKQ